MSEQEQMMVSDEQYSPADMAEQGAKQFRAGQAGLYTAEDMCSQASQGWRDGYAWAKLEGCQPADDVLDVAGLVAALRSILGWRELRSGPEFPVERVEDIARSALQAHQKREEGK